MTTPSPRTPFRSSPYVDFNTGVVALDPMALLNTQGKPTSFAKKLRLFECRVEVWQLGVAAEMLRQIEAHHDGKSIWCHAAYGLVSVAFSYFEMIGKTVNPGSQKKDTANVDFSWGICDVYPAFKPKNGVYTDSLPHTGPGPTPPASARPNRDIALVKAFRDRIRNGMYHLAYTKRGLRLHDEDEVSPNDFHSRKEKDPSDRRKTTTMYYMNPHRVTRTIIDHFPGFVARLKKTSNAALRQKFENFYDEFHKVD